MKCTSYRFRPFAVGVVGLLSALGLGTPSTAEAIIWTSPTPLTTQYEYARDPAIVSEPDDGVTVVYAQRNYSDIYTKLFSQPQGWQYGDDMWLGSGSSAPYSLRAVAGANGVVDAIWVKSNGTNDVIETARFDGSTWSARTTLSATGLNASAPEIAADSSGNITAVWVGNDGSGAIIQASRFNGTSWSVPTNLSASGQPATMPTLAVDPAGVVTAVWRRNDGTNFIIQAARYTNNQWSTPVNISESGANALSPKVGVDEDGDATVIWSSGGTVIKASRSSGSMWSAPVSISATLAQAVDPALAVAPDGSSTAVWIGANSGEFPGVQASRFNGGYWSAPTTLATAEKGASGPKVADAGDGVAIAVWARNEFYEPEYSIQGARFIGGRWDEAQYLYRGNLSADRPQIVIDTQGTATVVWREDVHTFDYIISASRSYSSVPLGPIAPSATIGDSQATVSWSAPTSDGGEPITQYIVTAQPGGDSCTWSSGPLRCIFTGLTNGTAYTFAVTAVNSIGQSDPSTSAAVTPITTPSAPTTVIAEPYQLLASVRWSAPASNGGSAITSYTVTSNPGGWTCTQNTGFGNLGCAVVGLEAGVPYTFTVTATNAAGTGPATLASPAITPYNVPAPPSSVGATPLAGGRVNVAFVAGSANGSAIASHTATCSSPDGGITRSNTGSNSPIVVTSLTPGKTYSCTVKSENIAGFSQLSTASSVFPSGHAVTVSPFIGNGTVTDESGQMTCSTSCMATEIANAAVTLTATPASGWRFSHWGGACSGSQVTCSVFMNQARDVNVTFVEAPSNGGSGFTSTPLTVPTPSGVRWTIEDLWIVAVFASTTQTGYAIAATSGSAVRTGTCSHSAGWMTCRVAVTPGTWVGSISPTGNAGVSLAARSLQAEKVTPVARASWTAASTTRPLVAQFKASPGTAYAISATLKGKTMRGRCAASSDGVACTIPLRKSGTWVVTITPKAGSSFGKPLRRTFKV
jgi:hypothetical protein